MEIRQLTRISLMTAAVVTGRLMFSFLPNIQPMTVMLFLITLHFGFKEGLLTALLSLMVSNLQLGFGPWTLAQLVSFFILIGLMQLNITCRLTQFKVYMTLFIGLSGFMYGFVISLVQAPFFGWVSFIPYWLSGLPYDLMHSVGNIGFWFLLTPIFTRLFTYYSKGR